MPQTTEEMTSTVVEPESSILASPSQDIAISVVVPVMNEEQNVRPLYEKLSAQLNALGQHYEIIFVDDGSADKTFLALKALHADYPGIVHVIRFRRNFGKTPALGAGFSRCRGEGIFAMDRYLQDDPEEIPRFMGKLVEGYELVSVSKFPRHDPIMK